MRIAGSTLTCIFSGAVHGSHPLALLTGGGFLHGKVEKTHERELTVASEHLFIDTFVQVQLLGLVDSLGIEQRQDGRFVGHNRPKGNTSSHINGMPNIETASPENKTSRYANEADAQSIHFKKYDKISQLNQARPHQPIM